MWVLWLLSFVFMSENFESGAIPASWTIYDHGIVGNTWTIGSGWDVPLQPPDYGSYYVYLDGPGIDTLAADTLVSPVVDISLDHSSLIFTCGISFYGEAETTDSAIIIVRFHTGGAWGDWNILRAFSRDMFQEVDTFDLYTMAGSADSLQIGFAYIAGDSSAGFFAVDNIEISGQLIVPNDVAVDTIISPTGYVGTDPHPVQVVVVNNSSASISNIPLTVIITDTATGNEVYNSSTTFDLSPQETLTVTLTENFQATSDSEFFNVIAFTSLSGDPTPGNDTAYALAYSYPVLGTILDRWALPDTNNAWYGTSFTNGLVYIMNFFTGMVIRFNPETEVFDTVTTLPGTDTLYYWDLTFDKETGIWWVTAFRHGSNPEDGTYLLKFDSNWQLLQSVFVNSSSQDARIGAPSTIDDKPFTENIIYSAAYRFSQPIKFSELDVSDPANIGFIDSTYIIDLIGTPATLSRLSDTLFLVQQSGSKHLYLVSTDWSGNHSIVMEHVTDSMPTGGDVAFDYYENLDSWVIAYMTYNGNELAKVSMGLKWRAAAIGEKESNEVHTGKFILISHGILPAYIYDKIKNTPVSLYSVDGRMVFHGRLTSNRLSIEKGVYFLKTRDKKTFKILNR